MAAQGVEERVLTVFADVHYYFSEPTPRPPAHRFDKGSYLYYYIRKNGQGGRLEIANNVGKPEQDAFSGFMDSATIRQSHKHPTLCTVTVDGYGGQHGAPDSSVVQPEHHWRLPNTDPRNEGKYLFRIHTLDIYFWTVDDANSFVKSAGKSLQPAQIEELDAPQTPSAHKEVMSPVVQQLENVAIQDSAYHNGQTRDSRTTSTGPAQKPVRNESREPSRQQTPAAQGAVAFQPLAYNPAAPAAPEPIKHREKTPPPIDAETGTGLAAAAYNDHNQSLSHNVSSPSPYSGAQYPQSNWAAQPSRVQAPSFASPPPPSTGLANSPAPIQGRSSSNVSSFPPPPPQSGRGSTDPYAPTTFSPPSHTPQNPASPYSQQAVAIFSAPPQNSMVPFYDKDSDPQESPATTILGNSYVSGVRQPLQHLQPQYADYTPPRYEESEIPGGYSSYQYGEPQRAQQHQQPPHHHHHQGNEYDVHSQVYRPTPEEAKAHKPSKKSKTEVPAPTGKLEKGVERVDKGVNRFFKKLEKKIG